MDYCNSVSLFILYKSCFTRSDKRCLIMKKITFQLLMDQLLVQVAEQKVL